VAPGVDVISTQTGDRFNVFTGTSMAAPHVSGVIALIIQKRLRGSPLDIRNLLERSARDLGPPGRDRLFGSGSVDACKSLEALVGRSLCK
ncbi:MAG TPA: S8 family serine peptidase, partial [Pyrinomonadaceae bacterium]|nr:S8 family serine peptidase [Pyrinomonadaceae bacterium]